MNIMRSAGICLSLTSLIILPAAGQNQTHSPPPVIEARSPYSGMEARKVKALSAEQIADLEAGSGMALALAAELNGYPGPVHVIEHAIALKLTADQEQATRALVDAMKAETIPLGQHLITEETNLDGAFADRSITPETLREATAAIGTTQAMLRAAHLRFHFAQVKVLTAEQLRRYGELRGYVDKDHGGHGRK